MKTTELKPLENVSPASVGSGDLLGSLGSDQLDHVALGLLHSFGAELTKTGSSIIVLLENGKKVGVHGASITVGELWKAVETLTE
jgi:hypothetical protein